MTMEDRLARLEKQTRFLKASVAVLLLVLAGGLFLGAGQNESKVLDEVRAKKIQVVDDSGHVCISLQRHKITMHGGGGGSICLEADEDGPTIVAFGNKGQAVSMAVDNEGLSAIGISDKQGAESVLLAGPNDRHGMGMFFVVKKRDSTSVKLVAALKLGKDGKAILVHEEK